MAKEPNRLHTLQHAVLTKPTKVRTRAYHANVVPQGFTHVWAHTSVSVRHFIKDYSLAVSLTGIFLVLVTVAAYMRASQHISLANLLANVTSITQDYSSLVNKDNSSAPVRGNVSDDNQAPTGSSSSFAINSNGTSQTQSGGQSTGSGSGTGGGTTGGTGGTSTPPAVFGAAIASFQQGSVTLECTKPQPKAQFCSKRYDFSAAINTVNGPGNVSYGWRTNVSGGSEDGSYSAPSGSAQQSVQKSISISCLSPGSYTMQFVILSPSQVQSSTITINHNCVGI